MSVREYVGARYVPLFADPLTWDATRTYEPLTVVLYQGNSYTSRQAVPANIDITNTTYWAQTGNYNAQIEQYRAEVQTFDGRITANATAISSEETARQGADADLAADIADNTTAISNEATARQNADSDLAGDIAANTTAISNEVSARQNADSGLANDISTLGALLPDNNFSSTNTVKKYIDDTADTLSAEIDAAIVSMNRKPLLVLVGDSWTATSVYGDWLTPFKNALCVDIANYGAGGTGWNRGIDSGAQGTFAQQLAYAYSKMSDDDKSRVTGIIALGGVNDQSQANRDTAQTVSNILTGADNLNYTRNQYFPNVPIYGALNLQSPYYGNDSTIASKMINVIKQVQKELPKHHIISLNWVALSLYVSDGQVWDGSNLHLAQAGAGQFAQAMIAAFNGGYNAFASVVDNTARNGTHGQYTSIRYTFDNGIFTIQPRRFSISAGNNDNALSIPQSGFGWIGNVFHLSPNGGVNIGTFSDGSASQFGYLNASFGSSANINAVRGSLGGQTGEAVYYGTPVTVDVANYL